MGQTFGSTHVSSRQPRSRKEYGENFLFVCFLICVVSLCIKCIESKLYLFRVAFVAVVDKIINLERASQYFETDKEEY